MFTNRPSSSAWIVAALLCVSAAMFPHSRDYSAVAATATSESIPFAVKVLAQNDDGVGKMTFPEIAKLVSFIAASGAPQGSYDQARAAGIKTIWYVDPHRIGDVAGKMSDRPPITALDKNADIMKCSGGGYLNSTYSGNNGTYFGDPQSANLVAKTNAVLRSAAAHYGKIDYAWKDDAMLLGDQWADSWFCGDSPPALNSNGGNGMRGLGHGPPDTSRVTFANATPYSPERFLQGLAHFDDRLNVPVIDEGACNGDGTDLGHDANDGGATSLLVTMSSNIAGAFCEHFAEGWGNRQTVDGKGVDQYWLQDLNSGIEVISARKLFVSYEYIGNEGAGNRGHPIDFDQRGYIYASFMLLFDRDCSVYKPGAWGAMLKTAAPVMVLPENLLVPLEPLETVRWPSRITTLEHNGAYVREFHTCGYAGKPIGPCAAVVNPSSSHAVSMPALQGTYAHAVAFTGNNGAFTGRHGTPNFGDTGDLDFRAKQVPSTLPPAGWAILVR